MKDYTISELCGQSRGYYCLNHIHICNLMNLSTNIPKISKSMEAILNYDYHELSFSARTCQMKCLFSQAVKKLVPKTRSEKQIYIAMFEDSPRVENLIHPLLSEKFFNWTMTYRSDSDIPNPYGRIVSHENFSTKTNK